MIKYKNILLGLILISHFAVGQTGELEIIKAVESDISDYSHVDKLDELINGERWGFHSEPIGIPNASSNLESQGQNEYCSSLLW